MEGKAKSLLSALLVALLAGSVATPAVAAEGAVCIENATIDDLHGALASGRTTAADLVRAYTARIEAYDRAGPRLNAVRELNPDAPAIAATIDARKSGARRPLKGSRFSSRTISQRATPSTPPLVRW